MADADETAAITMEEAAEAQHHRPREARGRAAAAATLALGALLGLALSAALLVGAKSGWSPGAGDANNIAAAASPWGRGVVSLSEQAAPKAKPAATGSLVTRDFTAGASDPDNQLSVKEGQAVFVSQRRKPDWTYVEAADGKEGWIPNDALHAVVFMVMKGFTASGDGEHQPQLTVGQGDIIFFHKGHKGKWTYAYKISVGGGDKEVVVRQGWVPDWALESSMEEGEEPSEKVLAEKQYHKSVEDEDEDEDEDESESDDDGYGSNPVPGALKPKPTPQPNNFRLGIYQRADENALGALSVRHEMEASGGKTKTFIFTVTSAKGDRDHEMWSAELEPAGVDSLGRGMWTLNGHTTPSMFLMAESDNAHLVECSYFDVPLAVTSCLDEGSGASVCSGVKRVTRTAQRHVWEFQEELFGMFFSEPVGLPLESRSRNFAAAVIEKDPKANEPDAPDTQAVVARFANYTKALPETPIKRQMELVKLYTMETSLYHEMNKALRDDDLEKLKLLGAYIKELRDVFLTDHEYQIIKPFRGTVWRGISRVPDLDKAKRTYVPGKDFLWTAFTSTTTNKNVAMNWGQIVFEIKCDPPDGMYADEVFEYAPADVKEFSAYASEDEVLFPPNVKFRVLDVKEENGKPLICCVATALDGVGGLVEFGGNQDPCLMEDETLSPRVDDAMLRQLTEGGHPEVRARRALRATAAAGTLEAAKEWITSHEADPDIDAPIVKDPSARAVLRRVQSRPKTGFFLSEAGDVGRLYIQKARGGKRRAYIFSIIEASAGGLVWVACLQHKGHDPAGRDRWSLDGHPEGGLFLNNEGDFLEVDDDNAHRKAWRFHGDTYNRNAAAPWENNFLQDQLKKAKETKKLLTWWKDASELDPEAQQALEEQLLKVEQVKKLLTSIHKADMQLVKTDKGILKRETTQHLLQRLHI